MCDQIHISTIIVYVGRKKKEIHVDPDNFNNKDDDNHVFLFLLANILINKYIT